MSATNKKVRTPEQAGKQCVAVNETLDLIRDKWTLLVMGALTKKESLRYNELQRAVDGISQRMLTLTLKRLEERGLVKRTIFPTVPPRVDYEFTPMGHSLVVPLERLLNWSLEHRDAMAEARLAYAKKML